MMNSTDTHKFRESLRRFSKTVWAVEDFYERPLDDEVRPVLAEDADNLFFFAWRAMSRAYIEKACHHLEKLIAQCESPIEELMVFALCIACLEKADSVRYRVKGQEFGDLSLGINTFLIEPQAGIGPYRVDFLIEHAAYVRQSKDALRAEDEYEWTSKGLIIECDGHAYHEKTKEQAKRDKERDRELQKLGYQVFHYTGSEIWADVFSCANDAITALQKSMGETA
jgi:very-short-patch-repair endonuclease